MNRTSCRHVPFGATDGHDVRALGVRRCLHHTRHRSGASVWVWGLPGQSDGTCLCVFADRFLVAAEGGAARWRESADVVLGHAQPTLAYAMRSAEALLARAPGCALAAVPAGTVTTVFRTHAEQALLTHGARSAPACGVCLYPWLVAGHRLHELVRRCSRRR